MYAEKAEPENMHPWDQTSNPFIRFREKILNCKGHKKQCTIKSQFKMESTTVLHEIKVTPVTRSRVNEVDFTKLGFGKVFSDHMLVADYADGQWQQPEIIPFQPISISPSNSTLHYGQAIFEGLK